MTYNVYEVGNYVYFEITPAAPFLIGKIEQFIKTREGNVIANIRCFFRRRDLPDNLIAVADRNLFGSAEEAGHNAKSRDLNGVQIHRIKHRELFLSDKTEKLSATLIRGKCKVNFFIDTDCLLTYLENEDMYFYCFIYDHVGKRLKADRKQVRIGTKYQAEIPPLHNYEDNNDAEVREIRMWDPHNNLTDIQIDQFLLLTRSVGTFARAVDPASVIRSPLLQGTVASASRDITLFHAMNLLNENNYDMVKAVNSLIPSGSLVICKDELEDWSAAEAQIFEEGLAIYDKNFNSIRESMLPWKTLKSIIEYYYMWKASDRYLKRVNDKASVRDSDVRKVCIPLEGPYGVLNNGRKIINDLKITQSINGHNAECLSCNASSSDQWFVWGPEERKICGTCWLYWKKYGGLKIPVNISYNGGMTLRLHRCRFRTCLLEFTSKLELARHYTRDHGADLRYFMPTNNIWKKQPQFYLRSTPLTRISRRFCNLTNQPRKAARCPFKPINLTAIKQECILQMVGKSMAELTSLFRKRSKKRCKVTEVIKRLQSIHVTQDYKLQEL